MRTSPSDPDANTGAKVDDTVLPCEKTALPCCPVKLQISCGHAKHAYVLAVPGTPTRDGKFVLQVVADKTMDALAGPSGWVLTDKVGVTLISASCRRGLPFVAGPGKSVAVADHVSLASSPGVSMNGAGVAIRHGGSFAGNLRASALRPAYGLSGPYPVLGLYEFFSDFLLPKGPEVCRVSVNCCEGGANFQADVEVFPSQSWTGGVWLQYSRESTSGFTDLKLLNKAAAKRSNYESGPSFTEYKGRKFERTASGWEIGLTLKAKYGSQSLDFDPSLDKSEFVSMVTGALERIKDITAITAKASDVLGIPGKFEVTWPKIVLSGQLAREEVGGDWSVALKGEIKLALDPLIGFEAETDILDWVITMAGSVVGGPAGERVAQLLIKAKKQAEEDGAFEISLKLVCNGALEGDLGWNSEGDWWKPAKGDVKAKLEFMFEGKTSAKSQYWDVMAGAKIGLRTFLALHLEPNPNVHDRIVLRRRIEWGGLVFYYSYFVDRIRASETAPGVPRSPEDKQARIGGVKESDETVLVDPFSIPAGSADPAPESSNGGPDLASFFIA